MSNATRLALHLLLLAVTSTWLAKAIDPTEGTAGIPQPRAVSIMPGTLAVMRAAAPLDTALGWTPVGAAKPIDGPSHPETTTPPPSPAWDLTVPAKVRGAPPPPPGLRFRRLHWERVRIQRLHRYHTDAEYRAKRKMWSRRQAAKTRDRRQQPEFRAKDAQRKQLFRQRLNQDPEAAKRIRERRRALYAERMTDPVFRAKVLARLKRNREERKRASQLGGGRTGLAQEGGQDDGGDQGLEAQRLPEAGAAEK